MLRPRCHDADCKPQIDVALIVATRALEIEKPAQKFVFYLKIPKLEFSSSRWVPEKLQTLLLPASLKLCADQLQLARAMKLPGCQAFSTSAVSPPIGQMFILIDLQDESFIVSQFPGCAVAPLLSHPYLQFLS
jgi:hypothetical protein